MQEQERLLHQILDIGVGMIQSGAETHRVEDSLYRLCNSYGFTDCNIWVIPNNIQASVVTLDGACLSQIRHIRHAGVDYQLLDTLNDLCRHACAEHPSVSVLAAQLDSILHSPIPSLSFLSQQFLCLYCFFCVLQYICSNHGQNPACSRHSVSNRCYLSSYSRLCFILYDVRSGNGRLSFCLGKSVRSCSQLLRDRTGFLSRRGDHPSSMVSNQI